MVSLLVYDSPRATLHDCSKPLPAGHRVWAELEGRVPCGESSIPFLRAGALWGASFKGCPTQPAFPCRGDFSLRTCMKSIPVQEHLGWYGVTRHLCSETPQGFGSRGGFCAPTVLAEAEDPYVSTSSDCSDFNAKPRPLVQPVPAIVARGRKQRGVPQDAGKPGGPQAQQETCWRDRPSWASTRVPMSMCVIP